MDPQEKKVNARRLIITISLVLVTALLVGGGVWYFMDQNQKDIQATNEKTTQDLQKQIDALNAKTVKSETDSTTAETTVSKTFKIPELGIQFTLADSITDLEYTITATNSAGFSTKAFVASGGTACNATNKALGVVEVTTEAPINDTSDPNYTLDRSTGALVKQIGNKYIYFMSPQAVCSSTISDQAIKAQTPSMIRESLKTATAL